MPLAPSRLNEPELILCDFQGLEGVFDPYPLYARLREAAPVYRGPATGGLWFLSKWEDCNAMLRSRAFGNGPGAPILTSIHALKKRRTATLSRLSYVQGSAGAH